MKKQIELSNSKTIYAIFQHVFQYDDTKLQPLAYAGFSKRGGGGGGAENLSTMKTKIKKNFHSDLIPVWAQN